MGLLVTYKSKEYSHDCWGGREVFTYTHTGYFSTIEDWLCIKMKNKYEFVEMYEVVRKMDDSGVWTDCE